MTKKLLLLGHSPDADDAFMFYPLAKDKIETSRMQFKHILKDIETLNNWAMEGKLDISAISAHAYAYVHKKYFLLSSGASVGNGYGPIVVTREKTSPKNLKGKKIAIPGRMTTAFLVLLLFMPDFRPVQMPFDKIIKAVRSGNVDAGVLIHEGQITHKKHRLFKVIDLGKWWLSETGLPLPLGLNVVRKDLGRKTCEQVNRILKESIKYSLSHKKEALAYAMKFSRGLKAKTAMRFVGMYVNNFTLDLGKKGIKSLGLLYERALEQGIIMEPVELEICG